MMSRSVAVRPRYLAALGFLVLVGAVQLVVLAKLTSDQRLVGLTVNLAGRQRMLSQRIPSLARDLVLEPNRVVRDQRRDVLRKTVAEMLARHDQLVAGDAAVGPSGWPPAAAREIYFAPPVSLDAQVRDFVDRAMHVTAASDAALNLDQPDLNYLIARRDAVLLGEDRVVKAYVDDGQERARRLIDVEVALFAVELAAIVLILLFLFVPMEREITRQRRALIRENEGLATVVKGSQALAETLALESLVARFVEGAERLLGVPVVLVGEASGASLPVRFDTALANVEPGERELVERSFATKRLERADDGSIVALSIDVFAGDPKLAILARGTSGLRRPDLVALEIFATNLQLAAHNASLFRDLEEREARVAELDRLKSDLIAMLAHDFKGPLTSIIGYAELMREGFIEGEELTSAVDYIVKSAWRLSSLASDTLAMSQLERGDFALETSDFDVVELVRDTADSIDGHERVRFSSGVAALTMTGDLRRLRQVFENLIGNALKYSPGGEPVEVALTHDGGRVRIAISDRGIGIPADELDHVFERFSRASNARSSGINGTGFGLYLTKLIVEHHGGSIELRSTVGAGSTFTVGLPIRVSEPAASAPAAT
jgi:signal transduction histidine kinase